VSRKFIPFGMLPSHWGLRGKTRDIAEAYYNLSGKELEYRLLEIESAGILTPQEKANAKRKRLTLDLEYGIIDDRTYDAAIVALDHPNKKSAEHKQGMLKVRLDHGEIEQYEYDKEIVALQHKNKESADYKIAMANLNRQHEVITELEYEKEIATINGKPWVHVIHAEIKYDPEGGNSLEFELDWNEPFVADLMNSGYTGMSQSEIVDQWFTQTCVDVFNTDPDFIMPEEVPSASTTQRKSNGDRTEFS